MHPITHSVKKNINLTFLKHNSSTAVENHKKNIEVCLGPSQNTNQSTVVSVLAFT